MTPELQKLLQSLNLIFSGPYGFGGPPTQDIARQTLGTGKGTPVPPGWNQEFNKSLASFLPTMMKMQPSALLNIIPKNGMNILPLLILNNFLQQKLQELKGPQI